MRRREFLFAVGSAAIAVCGPARSFGQGATGRRLIVYLGAGTSATGSRYIDAFRAGLAELNLRDGSDIEIRVRMAESRVERLPGLAEEAVSMNPALIVAGSSDAAVVVKKLTSSIPIISGALADAQNLGLVKSDARPGGNVTGVSPYLTGLPAKQIELLREIVPKAAKIGLLANLNDPKAGPQRDEMMQAATGLGLAVVVPPLIGPEDLGGAVQVLSSEGVDGVAVLETTMLLSARDQIARLIADRRIPAVYGYREHVAAGGLISYGVDLVWCWRRVATFAQKILGGTPPADLPVEFPTKVQMAINLKTARALGVTIPPTLLTRADEVIE
jgi:putative tryptophan/tyrosine transport system substrate-binding protein